MKKLAIIFTTFGQLLSLELDLSQWTRAGKQFGGNEEGGVALGLVSALQKWANSLENIIFFFKFESYAPMHKFCACF